MQLLTIAEMFGIMVVGAATMRATISALSFAGKKYQLSRQDRQYITQFQSAASRIYQAEDVEPEETDVPWVGKRRFQVVRREYENSNRDVCSFYLKPHDGRPIPTFRPGQFLTFSVPVPGHDKPEMRCYSLSQSPTEEDFYRVTVKRIDAPENSPAETPPGRSSSYFHDHLQPGALVETYAPAGSFCLDQNSDRPIILIAGGIGITPLLSMLNWLVATGSKREVWLLYGVRNRGEHIMYDALKRLNAHTPNIRLLVAYSQPTEWCQKNIDYHVKGHITAELLRPVLEVRNCEIYLCGPNAMMTSMREGLEALGVPREDIRFESFGQSTPGTKSAAPANGLVESASSFRIEFSRSGKTFSWSPRDGSLLELAIEHNIKARCACRQGVCGTCAVALKEGTVAYERQPENEPAAGTCLPCIAQPQSDLVLDL